MANSKPASRHSWDVLSKMLLGGMAATVTAFFIYALAGRWGDVRGEGIEFEAGYFALAVLCVTIAVAGLGIVWKAILEQLDGRREGTSFRLLRGFFYAWLGRYVPGTVPFLVMRVEMAQRLGYGRGAVLASLAYENVLQLGTALLLSLLLLVAAMRQHIAEFWFYGLALIPLLGAIAIAHPRVLVPSVNRIARAMGRPEISTDAVLPARAMVWAVAGYGAFVVVNGLGFFFLLNALTNVGPGYVPTAIGIYNLAGVVGILAVVLPSGLGVREGLIISLVGLQFPLEVAVAAAVLARVAAVAADGLPAAAVVAVEMAQRLPICRSD